MNYLLHIGTNTL